MQGGKTDEEAEKVLSQVGDNRIKYDACCKHVFFY